MMTKTFHQIDSLKQEYGYFIIWIIIALYLFSIGYAIVSQRPFFADGANYFLRILESKSFQGDSARRFAHYLTELPVIFSIKFLHVTNINVLSYIFGFGLYLPQIISLILCYSIAVRTNRHFMIFPIIALFGLSLNMSFFIISELHVILNIFWPILFYITLIDEFNCADIFGLFILSLIFLRSYESALIFGILLITFLTIIIRKHWYEATSRTKVVWVFLMIILFTSIVIAANSIMFPAHPASKTSFLSSLTHIQRHWMVLLSIIYMLITSYCIFVQHFMESLYFKIILILLIPFTILTSLIPALMPDLTRPIAHYEARSYLSFILPLLSIVSFLVLKGTIIVPDFAWKKIVLIVSVLAVSQLTWQILATCQWVGFRQIFMNELSVHNGIIPFEETLLDRKRVGIQLIKPMTWGHTNPTLSILWSKNKDVCSIINNPKSQFGRWQPFDPLKVDNLPNLEEFGFSFVRYKMSLAQRNK